MEKALSHAGQRPQKQSMARQSNDTSSFVKMKTSPMTFNSWQNPQYWLHYFPPVARVCVVKYHHQFLNIFFNRLTTTRLAHVSTGGGRSLPRTPTRTTTPS